jgi:diguanylate cyclase (GGDEF)-like protein
VALRRLVTVVLAAYCTAVAAAAVLTPPAAGQLPLGMLLVAGSGIVVEVTRRLGEPAAGVIRDVYGIVDLPTAILLGPLWALIVPVPRAVWTQIRVRRGVAYRRAYSAAATGMAYALAAVVFRGSVHVLGPGSLPGTGTRAVRWVLLAAGCGSLRLSGDALVLAAIRLSAPQTRVLAELIGPEAIRANVAELAMGTLAAFVCSCGWVLIALTAPLVWAMQAGLRHSDLVRAASTDSKTGILNDSAWRRAASAEIERARRDQSPTAVAILDIDHFKMVNDTYGHLAGDGVLAAVAAAARAAVRSRDLIGRIGGEEFAILLPCTSAREAAEVAQRLRLMVPQAVIPPPAPGATAPARVTVSVGVAAGWGKGWDLNGYLALADNALYAAKHHGRNEVWIIRDDNEDLRPRMAGVAAWPSPPGGPGVPRQRDPG